MSITEQEISRMLESMGVKSYTVVETPLEKRVLIPCKEDFDLVLGETGEKAYTFNPSLYGMPPFAGKAAFFSYCGWTITGIISVSREEQAEGKWEFPFLESDYDTF